LGKAVVVIALVACGADDEEEVTGPDEDTPRFACHYQTKLTDSCNNPEGGAWVDACVDVLTEEDCELATEEMREEVGDCTFTTLFRRVETTPMEACPEVEMDSTGPEEIEGRELGEDCSSLAQCASGLCVPRFYCTMSCSVDDDCDDGFSGGCCVGEGSLGYCLDKSDCADLCPEHSTPMGLPSICVCDDGFDWNTDFTACDPA
jgi:hypothetical protein